MTRIDQQSARYKIEPDSLLPPKSMLLFAEDTASLFAVAAFTAEDLAGRIKNLGWIPKKLQINFATKINALLTDVLPDKNIDTDGELKKLGFISDNIKLNVLKYWFESNNKYIDIKAPVFLLLAESLSVLQENSDDVTPEVRETRELISGLKWKKFNEPSIIAELVKNEGLTTFLGALSASGLRSEFESFASFLLKDCGPRLKAADLNIILEYQDKFKSKEIETLLWGDGSDIKPWSYISDLLKSPDVDIIEKLSLLQIAAEHAHPQALDYIYSSFFDKNNDYLKAFVVDELTKKEFSKVIATIVQKNTDNVPHHLLKSFETFSGAFIDKLPIAIRREDAKSIHILNLFGTHEEALSTLADIENTYKSQLPADQKYRPISFDFIDSHILSDFDSVSYDTLVESMSNYSVKHQEAYPWSRSIGIDRLKVWATLSKNSVLEAFQKLTQIALDENARENSFKADVIAFLQSGIDAKRLYQVRLEAHIEMGFKSKVMNLDMAVSELLLSEKYSFNRIYDYAAHVLLDPDYADIKSSYYDIFRKIEEKNEYQDQAKAPYEVLTRIVTDELPGQNVAWNILSSLVEEVNPTQQQRTQTISDNIKLQIDIESLQIDKLWADTDKVSQIESELRIKTKEYEIAKRNLSKDPRKYDASLVMIATSVNKFTQPAIALLLHYKEIHAVHELLIKLDPSALNVLIDSPAESAHLSEDGTILTENAAGAIKLMADLAEVGNQGALNHLMSRWQAGDDRITEHAERLLFAEITLPEVKKNIVNVMGTILSDSRGDDSFKKSVYRILYRAASEHLEGSFSILGALAGRVLFPIEDYGSLEYQALSDLLMPIGPAEPIQDHIDQLLLLDDFLSGQVEAPLDASDQIDVSLRGLLYNPLSAYLERLSDAVDQFESEREELSNPGGLNESLLGPPADVTMYGSETEGDKYRPVGTSAGEFPEENYVAEPREVAAKKRGGDSAVYAPETEPEPQYFTEDTSNEAQELLPFLAMIESGITFAELMAAAEQKLYNSEVSINEKKQILNSFVTLANLQSSVQTGVVDLMTNLIWANGSHVDVIKFCVSVLKDKQESWPYAMVRLDEIHDDAQQILDSDERSVNESLKKLATQLIDWLES